MEYGSGQDFHTDSLFMTPLTRGGMVAWWIALEDVRPESGPLRLYRASHEIPPFHFSNGRLHAIEDELPAWGEYMERQLHSRGLQHESVYARAGDVVMWHADTVHGAEPIGDRSLTRKSMVGHYFRLADARRRGYKLVREGSGWWVRRRAQPVRSAARFLSFIERRRQNVRALLHQLQEYFNGTDAGLQERR
jgi:ectoine hydroxylase-related dioxygenase (phytanoyl-CoA dioxygenase family)